MIRHIIKADKDIPAECEEWQSIAIANMYAGTTGYKDGDSGHGGRAAFGFANLASLCFDIYLDGKKVECEELTVVFRGDDEISFCNRLLSFASETIQMQQKEMGDK